MKKSIIAISLVCILLINACSISKPTNLKTPDKVSDTAEYYKGHFLVLADQYMNKSKYSYADVTPKYIGDNYVAVSVRTERTQDNEFITDELIELYDYNGDLVLQTDLNEIEPDKSFSEICMGTTKNGISLLLADNNTSYLAMYVFDINSLKWNKLFDLDLSLKDFRKGFFPVKIFEQEDGFAVLYNWLDGNYYKSNIVKLDYKGNVLLNKEIESNSSISNADLWDGSLVYQDEQTGFCTLDLNTGKRQLVQMSSALYDIYKYFGSVVSDGRIIAKDGHEIRQYDIASGTEKVIQDLNYTDYNIYSLYNGYLAYYGKERTVILDLWATRNEASGRCKLIVLDKLDKNPYAGKKVLEVAPIWGITDVLGEAQRAFNQTNKKYFSYITTRYDIKHFKVPDYNKTETTLANQVTLITDQLTVDIRNGIGPDVIIGLGDTNRLDTEEYLVDLNPYINSRDGIDKADYFGNAIDAFSVDGHLYQMPLTINVLGILTDKNNIPAGRSGFSFDQYDAFVRDVCDGIDPISIGNNRESYFRYLFCSMHDLFVSNNTIDVDNDAFRILSKYAKNNISIDGYASGTETSGADWVVLSNIYYDLISTKCIETNSDIFGAPSVDDRGPMITNFNTIAITTCSSDYKSSWSFVKETIGYEAQKASANENPINRAAFYDFAKTAIKDANITLKERYDPRVLDETYIERYITMLEKANCVATFDSEIYQVIIEELQPYYAGDKDLDKVIPVIKNRCQTILNER